MSANDVQINHEQAIKILDIYGGLPDAWPADIRDNLLASIAASAKLQQEQKAALALDKLLNKHKNSTKINRHGMQALSKRIITALPENTNTVSNVDTFYAWMRNWLIQPIPVMVMAIAVLSISIINIQNTDPLSTIPTNEVKIFEEWAWLDITDQTLTSQDNQIDYSLMDLLELEADDA